VVKLPCFCFIFISTSAHCHNATGFNKFSLCENLKKQAEYEPIAIINGSIVFMLSLLEPLSSNAAD